jgi:hypothetical protein
MAPRPDPEPSAAEVTVSEAVPSSRHRADTAAESGDEASARRDKGAGDGNGQPEEAVSSPEADADDTVAVVDDDDTVAVVDDDDTVARVDDDDTAAVVDDDDAPTRVDDDAADGNGAADANDAADAA